jgi:hypothetical protein
MSSVGSKRAAAAPSAAPTDTEAPAPAEATAKKPRKATAAAAATATTKKTKPPAAAPPALKLFKAARQGFPRFVDLFPGGSRDALECLSTSNRDDGGPFSLPPFIGADYKSAKELLAALNAGGDFFCIGERGWLGGKAGACINLAEMAALGWHSTGPVRFQREQKLAAFAIVGGAAVLQNSRQAKAAQKARLAAEAAADK